MEIGRLTPQEWPWLLSRTAATAWEHVPVPLRAGTSPERVAVRVQQAMANLLSQPGGIALVAREDGRAVGYLVITILPEELTGSPIAFFYDIYVEPHRRGAGISSRLTAAGEEYCRSQGVRVIRRMISTQNTASLRHALGDGCQPEQLGFIKVI